MLQGIIDIDVNMASKKLTHGKLTFSRVIKVFLNA